MSIPGRHGSVSNTDLEMLICRNSQFLAVRRSGSADGGSVGLINTITGKHVAPIGPGRIPEYTVFLNTVPSMVRGWRFILRDLIASRHVQPTREIRRWMGDELVTRILDYGNQADPGEDPNPTKVWLDGDRASGTSGRNWQGGM